MKFDLEQHNDEQDFINKNDTARHPSRKPFVSPEDIPDVVNEDNEDSIDNWTLKDITTPKAKPEGKKIKKEKTPQEIKDKIINEMTVKEFNSHPLEGVDHGLLEQSTKPTNFEDALPVHGAMSDKYKVMPYAKHPWQTRYNAPGDGRKSYQGKDNMKTMIPQQKARTFREKIRDLFVNQEKYLDKYDKHEAAYDMAEQDAEDKAEKNIERARKTAKDL